MLKLMDSGCNEHHRRRLRFSGTEANLLATIIYNLPHNGDCYTYICEYGHTHRLTFQIQADRARTAKPSQGVVPLTAILEKFRYRHIS
jgi:hypothetical protein